LTLLKKVKKNREKFKKRNDSCSFKNICQTPPYVSL
jgi:hypothetical protein